MKIPFTKAHGAGNDFVLTWQHEVPAGADLPALAREICARHEGIGADGWMLLRRNAIRLFNADGSEPEISGNGTRCAAAFLLEDQPAADITIDTGAGPKHLRLISVIDRIWMFEMDMGLPRYAPGDVSKELPLHHLLGEVTLLDVGNPQCAVFVTEFPEDWERIGAEVESHPYFPKRTNVSFVRVVDRHTLDVRFFERGVGPTKSSGTGSTGAAAAAILRCVAESPVTVKTLAGDLVLRWDDSLYLTGPATIIGKGEFYPRYIAT
ncbi:MAG TPA: diaminopimelate epimerase [Bryobacteraceae bacterium]|nr:diaminopimelate epimerase [Bryobacteraceae bacterium]